MTTGALKNHWSTENQLRRNAFNVDLKREIVAALCKLKHFGPWNLIPKSLIFVRAGNNVEHIRISSNIAMNLICHQKH